MSTSSDKEPRWKAKHDYNKTQFGTLIFNVRLTTDHDLIFCDNL